MLINRQVRLLPSSDKAQQTWVPYLTDDGVVVQCAPEGKAVRVGRLSPPIMRLIQAHLGASPRHTLGAIGHGVRAVCDPISGTGAPFFVERKGCGKGEIYIFGGGKGTKPQSIVGALGGVGGGLIDEARVEKKGGLYLTLTTDADCGAVYRVLSGCASTHSNNKWSAMGEPMTLVDDDVEAAPVAA